MAKTSTENTVKPKNTVKAMAEWLMSQDGYKDWSLEDAKKAYNQAHNPKNETGKSFRKKAYYEVFPDKAPKAPGLKLSFTEALAQLQDAYNRKEPDLKEMSKDDLSALLFKVAEALKVAK